MTIQIFANNATTTLADPISSSQTLITVANGAIFPTPLAGQSFTLTLNSVSNPTLFEICACTNRSGNILTVVRGTEGTSPAPFVVGDLAANYDTAFVMKSLVQSIQLQQGYYNFATSEGTANALVATIPSQLTGITVPPNGFTCIIQATSNNTGAATLGLTLGSNLLSPRPITKNGNQALTGGEITSGGYPCILVYSTAYNSFVLTNPFVSEAGLVYSTEIQNQRFTYGVATGGSNSLTVELPAGLTSLVDGALVCFRASFSNGGGGVVLQVIYGTTTLDTKPLVKGNNLPLLANDILLNGIYFVVYNSAITSWVLLNPSISKPVVPTEGGTGKGSVTTNNALLTTGNGSVFSEIAPTSAGSYLVANGTAWTPAAAPVPKILYQAQISQNTLISVPAWTNNATGADLVGRPIQLLISGQVYQGGNTALGLNFQWGINGLQSSTNVFPTRTVNFEVTAAGTAMPYVSPTYPYSYIDVQVNEVGSGDFWAWLTITAF